MRLTLLEGSYAVARAAAATQVPQGILDGPGFRTVSRSAEELSVVAPEAEITGMDQVDRGWACFKLHGPFGFDEVGIVAGLSRPLAEASVGIFVISTFDTDYLLVKDPEAAANLWRAEGHTVDA